MLKRDRTCNIHIYMEEDLDSLIDSVHPTERQNLDLTNIQLSVKYIPALQPNPKLIKLYYRRLVNTSRPPKASLCIIHGFAEHSGKFIPAAVRFAQAGYEVHTIDLRHLGVSGGARGGHQLFELQRDVEVLLKQADSNLPLFLWGQSMGGLLATTVLINNPNLKIAGAIITSPLFATPNLDIRSTKIKIMKFLLRKNPEMLVNGMIYPSALSRDDVYVRHVYEDKKLLPFCGGPMAASMGDMMETLQPSAHLFKHPVMFIHGDNDVITLCSATMEFYKRCGSAIKTMKVFKGGYHELHHDLDKEEMFRDMIAWLDSNLSTAVPVGNIPTLKIGVPGLKARPDNMKWILIIIAVVYLVGVVKYKPANFRKFSVLVKMLATKLLWPIWVILSPFIRG